MKTSFTKRILSFLLVICLVIPMAPQITLPARAETQEQASANDPVIVVAGSDFQADTHELSAENVKTLLKSVKNNGGYSNVDGFLFAGDYTNVLSNQAADSTINYNSSVSGLESLKAAVEFVYPDLDSAVYIQGNHDPSRMVTEGLLSRSGANDTEHYGVFVINEDDLAWHKNGTEDEAKATAADLSEYLEAKIKAGYNKPIFVVSHIPLHYTMRTYVNGDGRYANYVFDVLNRAGEIGLNIIFLFGHHHSNSWLDSQGGSAVLYGKNDKINIPQASQTEYKEETLQFTYMNAGFVGYYTTTNTNSGVESDLNMSVFEIDGNNVQINRYTANGLHLVKSAGVANSAYAESWPVNTKVEYAPKSVLPMTLIADSDGKTAYARNLTGMKVDLISTEKEEGYDVYHTYEVTLEGYTSGNNVTISVPLDQEFDATKPVIVMDASTGTFSRHEIIDGRVVFKTKHTGQFVLAQGGITYTATGTVPEYKPILATTLVPGESYVIKAGGVDWMLSGDATTYIDSTEVTRQALVLEDVPIREGDRWLYAKATRSTTKVFTLSCGGRADGYLTNTNSSSYLCEYATNNSYSRNEFNITLNADGETFFIQRDSNKSDYLHQPISTSTPCAAASNYDPTSQWGGMRSSWYFYTLGDGAVNVSVDAVKTKLTIGQTTQMMPASVTLEGEETTDYTLTWSVENSSIATVDTNGFVKALRPGTTNIVATVTEVNGIATTEAIQCKIPLNVDLESMGTPVDGVTVDAEGVTGVYAFYAESDCPDGFTCYYSYDIIPVNYTVGTEATVSIPVEDGIDRDRSVFIIDHEQRKTLQAQIVDDCVTFTTDHFSVYSVAQMEEKVAVSDCPGQINIAVTTGNGEGMVPGIPYLITDNTLGVDGYEWMLTGETATKTGSGTGLLLEPYVDTNTSHVWYVDEEGYLRYLSPDGKYVHLGSESSYDVWLNDTRDDTYSAHHYLYASDSRQVNFGRANTTKDYLNRNGGTDALTDNVALVFTRGTAYHSRWYVNKLVTGIKVTAQVSTSQTVMNLNGSIQLTAGALLDASEASLEVPESYLNVTDLEAVWSSLDTDVVTVDENGLVSPVSAGQAYVRATVLSVNGTELKTGTYADILITVEDVKVSNNVITASTHYGYQVGDTVWLDPTNLTPGGPYFVDEHYSKKILSGNVLRSGDEHYHGGYSNRTGLEMISHFSPYDPPLWYLDEAGLCLNGDTDKYIVYNAAESAAKLGPNENGNDVYQFIDSEYGHGDHNPWNIYYLFTSGGTAKYLYYRRDKSYHNIATQAGSRKTFYRLREVLPDRVVSFAASPAEDKVYLGSSLSFTPKVTVNGSKISDYTVKWASVDKSIATVNADGTISTVAEGKTYIVGYMTAIDGVELSAPLVVEIVIEVISEQEKLTAQQGQSDEQLVTVTEPQDGVPYIVSSNVNRDWVLTNIIKNSDLDSTHSGLQLKPFDEVGNVHVWYLETDDAGNRYLRYGNLTDDNNYLSVDSNNVDKSITLSAKSDYAYDSWTLATDGAHTAWCTDYSKYMNQHGGPNWDTAVATGSNGTHANSRWRFNTVYESKNYQFSVTPESAELNLLETLTLTPKLIFANTTKKSGDYKITYTSSDPTVATVRSGKIVPMKGGKVTIKVTLTQVTHDGVTQTFDDVVLYVPVTVHGVQSVTLNNLEGQLPVRASQSLKVSAMSKELADPTLTVTYSDGATSTTPLIGSYMTDSNGNPISTQSTAVYENVKVTYKGVVVPDSFKLHIIRSEEPAYPVYPEPGCVQLNKYDIDSENFRISGITQVELGVNGVPSKKGADIIVMLDTSSSMTNITANGDRRLYVLADSLNKLITQFQQVQEDGTLMDVRMAVADFNGAHTDENSHYYATDYDVVSDQSANRYNTNNIVFTGDNTLSAGAFMNVIDMGKNPFTAQDMDNGNVHFTDRYETSGKYKLTYHSGTNYDYAFDAVYQLGQAISDANALTGADRDLYVIFMSDGVPFQYNYYTSNSDSDYWTNWLSGTMENKMFGANATREYYNPRGEHWMAEAIMGDPTQTYPVIRKNDYRDLDGDNFIDVAGLGATMYALGFCLKDDGKIKEDTQRALIKRLASDGRYVYFPNTSDTLGDAFNDIYTDIQYAATDAYILDTMGSSFDLLLGEYSYTKDQQTVKFTDNRIQIRDYEIFTLTDYQLKKCEVAQIGTRKTDEDGNEIYTVKETVTFNAEGTEAYSDQILAADGSKINILRDGVIYAKNFWYNDNLTPVEIDFDGNGQIDDGELLDAETFYWKIGTITMKETVLNYYVELKGALEGDVNAGIYDTNESATLNYENYLGEDCEQIAPVPRVPWKNAQVGYGFYLVNKQGTPITNKDTGLTGSFEQSIESVVLTDVVYQEFNTGSAVSLVANRLFPRELLKGYRLFDDEARYDVSIDAEGNGGVWVYTNGIVPLSTYVDGLKDKPDLYGGTDGSPMGFTDFANANTVVWFAVTVADDAMTVDKTVEKAEGENKYTLTLESYSTGSSLNLPSTKPADIVLVLDQSSTMYTPVGIDADRISINDLVTVRQQLEGKEIPFDADDETIQENAKNLGYYIAIHNSGNYIYIVQYAQNSAGKWGWYYIPVDQTTRTVELDIENATNDTTVALNKGKDANGNFQAFGYGTYSQTTHNNQALPTTLVTYYQSQYGALYDTLQEFVKDLKEESVCSGLDHRVAVVGFASPHYDGWTGYDGTGIYVDGDYYLYDSDYKYVKDGVTYDPNKVFSSGADDYSDSSILSDSKLHEFNVTKDTYANALVSLRDNYQSVLNSVKAYKANYQQTCPSIGITIAQSIFGARQSTDNLFNDPSAALADKHNPVTPKHEADGEYYPEDQADEHLKSTYTQDNDVDREEIIILFTDGVPTIRCTADSDMGSRKITNGAGQKVPHPVAQEFWSFEGGIDDVLDHAYEAKQAGIKIYGIATSRAVMEQRGSDFFKHISSDDPTAQSQLTIREEWVSGSSWYLNSATPSVEIKNSSYTDKGYTKYANGIDVNLSDAFRTVYESIDSAVELRRDAVLKDVISDYFDLSAAASTAVKVYTADYLGIENGKHQFSDKLDSYTDAVVKAENGVISVSNFDYRNEFIGIYDGKARGRKLVVQVEIVPKKGFWGGNNVPTNKSDTAIYTPDGVPMVHFPVPEANVPVKPEIVTKNHTIFFLEPTLDTLVDMVESITVGGVRVNVASDGKMTPSEEWMDDYADLFWKRKKTISSTVPNSATNVQSGTYSFNVIAVPKSGNTGDSNTTGESNIAGDPISTDGVVSDLAKASVIILVPLITLRDSSVWMGEKITRDYLVANNWDNKVQWISAVDPYGEVADLTKVTMGTEPEVTVTFEYMIGSTPIFAQEMPFNVHVKMRDKTIDKFAVFNWIACTENHQTGQVIEGTDLDGVRRHKGDVESYEFYVHVKNLQPDAVVIDYGKPVSIDVMSNDGLPGTASLVGVKAGTSDVLYSHETDATIINEAEGTHGTMTVQGSKLHYTPGDMQMNSEDVFTYATTSTALSWSIYSTVTVIPATMIYYEDNAGSVTFHTESKVENLAAWEDIGTAADSGQDQDRPGIAVLEDLDADSVYGYDNSYKSSATYSNGSVHKVTVGRHAAVDANGDGKCDNAKCVGHNWLDASGDGACDTCGSKKCNLRMDHDKKDVDNDSYCDVCGLNNCDELAEDHECVDVQRSRGYCDICGHAMTHTLNGRASFTFTGTGFDILSACSAKTGVVMVSVYKGEVTNFDNPPWDNYVTSYIVDTYYSYGASEESNASRALVIPTEIYQVPVIKADLTKVYSYGDDPSTTEVESGYYYKNYGYGTYTVEIYVAPSFLEGEHAYEVSEFYLDSVRIYNPAGYSSTVDETALEAYKADKEAWPCYVEVRNMLIEQEKVNDSDPDQPLIDGLIYIDGAGLANFVSTYKSWGPNNEVYLPPTCSIAFTLNLEKYGEDVAGIHLAMRALNGSGRVTVDTGKDKENVTNLLNINLGTTDQYYNIGKRKNDAFIAAGNVVVITNTGSEFIAITNIKVTHNSKPTAHSRIEGMFQSNMMTSWIALEMLDAKRLADPVVTPKYPALSYNGMICYNVFFSAEELGNLTAADLGLAVFDSYDPEGTVETARDVIMGATEIDGLYMVETNGVHAKYLSDTQYFRAFAKKADGSYVYSKMVSYSALDYATNVLAKSDDVKLKQLVVAMLNYGAEAQKFFGYKTDDLMNKDLTVDHQALLTGFNANSLNGVQKADPAKLGAFASTGGFTSKYPAISFKGAFEINYFFTPANAVDGDMTLYFWNEDTYNSVTELTAENADKAVAMTLENGAYTASSDEIFARQLDKTLYAAAVYESNGVTYCSGVLPYSIAAYCQKPPADVQALATAAAIYGCTAKQFFGE